MITYILHTSHILHLSRVSHIVTYTGIYTILISNAVSVYIYTYIHNTYIYDVYIFDVLSLIKMWYIYRADLLWNMLWKSWGPDALWPLWRLADQLQCRFGICHDAEVHPHFYILAYLKTAVQQICCQPPQRSQQAWLVLQPCWQNGLCKAKTSYKELLWQGCYSAL